MSSFIDSDTRWVTPQGRRSHLLRSCSYIVDSDNVQEVDAEETDRDLCTNCANSGFEEMIDL